MPAEHKFLKFILPAGAFAAVEAGTREWLIECRCGHRQDYWDAGGVRYKATGEPRQFRTCVKCGKTTWHKVRKKTDAEKRNL